jgi:hypothetical protein
MAVIVHFIVIVMMMPLMVLTSESARAEGPKPAAIPRVTKAMQFSCFSGLYDTHFRQHQKI